MEMADSDEARVSKCNKGEFWETKITETPFGVIKEEW